MARSYTFEKYAALGAGGPAWLTPAERERVARIDKGRLLFQGRHKEYFVDGGRTMHLVKGVRSDVNTVLYIPVNIARLISMKFSDLLFGNFPEIEGANDAQNEAIKRISKNSLLPIRAWRSGVTASSRGEAFFKVRLKRGKVEIVSVPPQYCFPVRSPEDWEEIEQFEIKYELTRGEARYLRKEVHGPGWIRNELWTIEKSGELGGQAPLERVYPGLEEIEQTGLDRPLVVRVANFDDDDGEWYSDYDGAEPLFDELNNRLSQISRVLDKHADPKMAADRDMFTTDGAFKLATNDAVATGRDGKPPQYITWDPKLREAFEELNRVVFLIAITCEMSPVLIGLKEGAAPEAVAKLKLEATNTVSKVARKALYYDEALGECFGLAHEMENLHVPSASYEYDDVAIPWRDGLPEIEEEKVKLEAERHESGLGSRASGVRRLSGSDDEADREIKEIEAEEAAKGPSSFAGRSMLGAGGGEGGDDGD